MNFMNKHSYFRNLSKEQFDTFVEDILWEYDSCTLENIVESYRDLSLPGEKEFLELINEGECSLAEDFSRVVAMLDILKQLEKNEPNVPNLYSCLVILRADPQVDFDLRATIATAVYTLFQGQLIQEEFSRFIPDEVGLYFCEKNLRNNTSISVEQHSALYTIARYHIRLAQQIAREILEEDTSIVLPCDSDRLSFLKKKAQEILELPVLNPDKPNRFELKVDWRNSILESSNLILSLCQGNTTQTDKCLTDFTSQFSSSGLLMNLAIEMLNYDRTSSLIDKGLNPKLVNVLKSAVTFYEEQK